MATILWDAVINDSGLRCIATSQDNVLIHPQGILPCLVFASNSIPCKYLPKEDLQKDCDVLVVHRWILLWIWISCDVGLSYGVCTNTNTNNNANGLHTKPLAIWACVCMMECHEFSIKQYTRYVGGIVLRGERFLRDRYHLDLISNVYCNYEGKRVRGVPYERVSSIQFPLCWSH